MHLKRDVMLRKSTHLASGEALPLGCFAGLHVLAIPGDSPAREHWETAAVQAGIPLTLPQRTAWDPVARAQQCCMIAATDPQGEVQALCVARVFASRALPWHRVIRIERFASLPGAAMAAAMWGARTWAARIPRVIRVHVEVYDALGSGSTEAAAAAAMAGYTRWNTPRMYGRTVILDLGPDEEAIFSGLHATGRRHVRSVTRHPVEVREVGADFPTGVLEELLRETLGRTGGDPAPHAWAEILALSERRPELSRVVGLFRTDRPGPEGLLSFAWGCHHGDHAHYATAASTRRTDLRIPMMYPLAWELILWARRNGARTFDFGGISTGSAGGDDPLGGISDFKRRFTDRVVAVGSEWVFEPSPLRAGVARLASAAVQRTMRRVTA
jgi:hypothetical protein